MDAVVDRSDAGAAFDFNRFDAEACEAAGVVCLIDDLAAVRRLVPAVVLPDAADRGEDRLPAGALGGFLRVFLDIRLPFVAFGGSMDEVLQALSGRPERSRRLGKSERPGVWLQTIRRTTLRPLNALLKAR